MIAGLTHIPLDILFSDFHPYYPIENTVVNIYGWNSINDLTVESIFAIIFILTFLVSSEKKALKRYFSGRVKRIFGGEFNIDTFLYALFLLYGLYTFAQVFVFFIWHDDQILSGLWYRTLFFTVSCIYLVFLGYYLTLGLMDEEKEEEEEEGQTQGLTLPSLDSNHGIEREEEGQPKVYPLLPLTLTME